jgi:hypothetical protein
MQGTFVKRISAARLSTSPDSTAWMTASTSAMPVRRTPDVALGTASLVGVALEFSAGRALGPGVAFPPLPPPHETKASAQIERHATSTARMVFR